MSTDIEYGRQIIRLDTARSWPVIVGAGVAGELANYVDLKGYSSVVLVTDENVARLHGEYVLKKLESGGPGVTTLTLPAGERTKSLRTAERCYRFLLERGTDRRALFCVLGGGVAGDLGGYLAATYLRGVDYVQVPTTLLGQVDAGIGGKVGVNFGGKKNMVGSFYQPAAVVCDVSLMSTLPRRQFRNGLAEVIKYGLAMDGGLFELLEKRAAGNFNDDELAAVVLRCVRLKAGVVALDETERTGQRAILNFGHTAGHALETVTGLRRLTHGEAVAVGMAAVARIGRKLGMIAPEDVIRIDRLLQKYGLPAACPGVDVDAVMAAIRYDKKTTGGDTKWVLPVGIGRGITGQTVDAAVVLEALQEVCR